MSSTRMPQRPGRLLWVYSGDLRADLDAATWLQTTRNLRQLGWDVTLITAATSREQVGLGQIDGVDVVTMRIPRVWLLGQALFHAQVLKLTIQRRRTLDALLFHEMSALWLLPLRLRGRHRPRLVMDTRTLFMGAPHSMGLKDRLRAGYIGLMQRLSNRFADGRLCITPAMAEVCNVPANKLWGIWPSGVCPEAFAVPPGARQWPTQPSRVEIYYVGVLDKERGLASLCQAIRLVNRNGRHFRLTLIGDGSARAELDQYASDAEGGIRIIAPIPHSQVPGALRQAHVGALPFPDQQKFRVSSPIKLFEYLASGLPVLATRIRCHTDVLADRPYVYWAESSSVAELAAVLEQIWHSRSRLADLGAQAASEANTWSWAASAKRLSDALERNLRARPITVAAPHQRRTAATANPTQPPVQQ